MDKIKQAFKQFDGMSLRERALIIVTAIFGIAYLWWNFWAEAAYQELTDMRSQNDRHQQEVKNLELMVNTLESQLAKGIKNRKKEQLERVQSQLKKIERELKSKTVELIDPEDMFQVLSQLINKRSNLKILGLKRLSVTPIREDNAPEEQAAKFFRHNIQIKLQGNYDDITQYMAQLENMEWKLIWNEIALETIEYPDLRVTIELSTLSQKAKWLGLS